jgi:UDP-glucose 4,6-dehydratase
VHGDGGAVRSYLFVEDVAAAFDTVLHKGLLGEVYNIGTQVERSVVSVAADICGHFNLPQGKIVNVRDRAFNDRWGGRGDTGCVFVCGEGGSEGWAAGAGLVWG